MGIEGTAIQIMINLEEQKGSWIWHCKYFKKVKGVEMTLKVVINSKQCTTLDFQLTSLVACVTLDVISQASKFWDFFLEKDKNLFSQL